MKKQQKLSNPVRDSRFSKAILSGIRRGNLRSAAALIVVVGSTLSLPAVK